MRIALAQIQPGDPIEPCVIAAKQGGAQVLVTPEMALTGYAIGADAVRAKAASLDQGHWSDVAHMAARYNIAILAGGPEAMNYNTAALFDTTGALMTSYRKTHLYGDLDAGQFTAGNALSPVIDLYGIPTAIAICFDIEFPEVARTYAMNGAELILVPTANMHPFTGIAQRVVPTRAEENGIYIAYANFCGSEGDIHYCGQSVIAGPDGSDCARAGTTSQVIFADIKREDVKDIRKKLPYLNALRSELYL